MIITEQQECEECEKWRTVSDSMLHHHHGSTVVSDWSDWCLDVAMIIIINIIMLQTNRSLVGPKTDELIPH